MGGFAQSDEEDLLRELLVPNQYFHRHTRCWHTQSPAMNFGLS